MKNFTLIFLLFLSSISFASANAECSNAEITLSQSGEDVVNLGQAILIQVCLVDCPYLNVLEAGGNLLVDLQEPNGEINTISFEMEHYINGTNSCFELKFGPDQCGVYKVGGAYQTDSFGGISAFDTEYTNGYYFITEGLTVNNNFETSNSSSSITVDAQDFGLPHSWTLNGAATNCNEASCSFSTGPNNTYTICHSTVANNVCDNDQVCQTVVTACPEVNIENDHGIKPSQYCNGNIILYTPGFAGFDHRFSYREVGQSSWTTTNWTIYLYKNIGGNFDECIDIEIRIQVRCGSNLSAWSEVTVYTTRPDQPVPLSLSVQVNPNSVLLGCFGYSGDQKQARYWISGTGGQIPWSQYFGIPGDYVEMSLAPNTAYKYQVRRRCGYTGEYSCWSAAKQFTTTAGLVGEGAVSRNGIEEELIIENHQPRIACSPNPSNGRFTVAGDLIKVGNQMTIHNLMGKKVIDKTINDDINMELNLDLEAGTYFLSIIDATTGKLTSKRIVVQNL